MNNEQYEVGASKKGVDIPEWVNVTGGLLFIGIFIVWPIAYSVWYDVTKDTPIDTCNSTTKEIQTIRKIDGGVTSVDTETVYGCEYPDGTFIPAPDN